MILEMLDSTWNSEFFSKMMKNCTMHLELGTDGVDDESDENETTGWGVHELCT